MVTLEDQLSQYIWFDNDKWTLNYNGNVPLKDIKQSNNLDCLSMVTNGTLNNYPLLRKIIDFNKWNNIDFNEYSSYGYLYINPDGSYKLQLPLVLTDILDDPLFRRIMSMKVVNHVVQLPKSLLYQVYDSQSFMDSLFGFNEEFINYTLEI